MFPVYVLEKGQKLPETGTFYVVGKNGLFLVKDTGLIRATVPVKGVSFLEQVDLSAQLLLPKLSQELIVRTLLFFRAVYKKHQSEAEVQLHYNSAIGEFMLHCPKQQVSGAGVHYDSKERFEGFQLVGTIHSHAGFGAFHSGIDQSDEKNFDGLHITIGHLNQPYFTISCSMTVNGQRFTFQPEDVIIGIKKVDWKIKPFMTHRRPEVSHLLSPVGSTGLVDSLIDRALGGLSIMDSVLSPITTVFTRSEQFWDIAMPEDQDYRNVGFPKSWLEQVSTYNPQTIVNRSASPHSSAGISSYKTGFEDDGEEEFGERDISFWKSGVSGPGTWGGE